MKVLIYSMLIFTFGFLSCTETVEGPQGPPGPPGEDGISGEAYVFEYEVDFVSPDYSTLIFFPTTFQMLESDVVQVYLLWGQDDGKDLWRPLPQTLLTNDGLFQYNYDFTTESVSIFLEAEFPISDMPGEFLFDQILRIVVIPGLFEDARMNLDLSDYYEVEKRFNLKMIKVDQK